MLAALYNRGCEDTRRESRTVRNRRVVALRAAHVDDPDFGFLLLADEARKAGFPIVDRTAGRLCRNSPSFRRPGRMSTGVGAAYLQDWKVPYKSV